MKFDYHPRMEIRELFMQLAENEAGIRAKIKGEKEIITINILICICHNFQTYFFFRSFFLLEKFLYIIMIF